MELLVSFHSHLRQYGSKSLARTYQISRGTVNTVYDMLQAEEGVRRMTRAWHTIR